MKSKIAEIPRISIPTICKINNRIPREELKVHFVSKDSIIPIYPNSQSDSMMPHLQQNPFLLRYGHTTSLN